MKTPFFIYFLLLVFGFADSNFAPAKLVPLRGCTWHASSVAGEEMSSGRLTLSDIADPCPIEDPQPPTESPTQSPTQGPTGSPTESPTQSPTGSPIEPPTQIPAGSPTESPAVTPAQISTGIPTATPTHSSVINGSEEDSMLLLLSAIAGGGSAALALVASATLVFVRRRRLSENTQNKNDIELASSPRLRVYTANDLERATARDSSLITKKKGFFNRTWSNNSPHTKCEIRLESDRLKAEVIVDVGSVQGRDLVINFEDIEKGNVVGKGASGMVRVGAYCGSRCAVKEIALAITISVEELDSLRREVTLLTRMRHPNLISFWGHCIHEDVFYLVMEYCPNSLESILKACAKRGDKLPDKDFISYAHELQRGLEYLHSKNVLHRDLKPGNLLVDDSNHIKIIDFGLARDCNLESSNGQHTQLVGTPYYMAPEVFERDAATLSDSLSRAYVLYGKGADVWSCGIIFWQMYSCVLPYAKFSKGSVMRVFDAVRNGIKPEMNDGVFPPVLKSLVLMCTDLDVSRRCTIEEVGTLLEDELYVESLLQLA